MHRLGDLRFQISPSRGCFCLVSAGVHNEGGGLLFVVQQAQDAAHLAVQLGPVQQVYCSPPRYMGWVESCRMAVAALIIGTSPG